jgi:diguanylate cyclase (GGDEF)-like protein
MVPSAEAKAANAGVAERYRVLLDIGRTLTGMMSRDDLYKAIYRETARVLEAAGFYISLYDAATIVFYADRGVAREVQMTYRGSDSEVIRTGRAALVEDRFDGGAPAVGDESGDARDATRSAISAPLIHKGRVLGSISSQSYRVRAYAQDDLELLQAIADIAAVALENARFVAALERQRREAEQVEEIGRAMAASLERQEVLQKVLDAVMSVLHADGASVWLIEQGNVARPAASSGESETPAETEWDLSGPLEERLVAESRPIVVADLGESFRVPTGMRTKVGSGSAVAVPLIVGAEVAGILSATSKKKDFFHEDETRVLTRLSSQASVALQNARLHANVKALSMTDPLTGLANRRAMTIFMEREVAAARRGRNLVVCVHDLDYFKQYNDRAGHLAGDDALRAFGQILAEENRTMNMVARFGGDEFVSVLSDATIEGAQVYLQRVNARVDKDPIIVPTGIKMSTGMAIFDRETMKTSADLLQAADAELYKLKGQRKR